MTLFAERTTGHKSGTMPNGEPFRHPLKPGSSCEERRFPLHIRKLKMRTIHKITIVVSLVLFSSAFAAAPQGWRLTDRFKSVSAGEWVKLRYSGGSEHLLLLAEKDEKTATLEERVREEGYLTSWTQVVIDLEKRTPIIFRERTPDGEVREVKIEGEKSNLDADFHALLTAEFWQEPGTERVIVPAGTFTCEVYRAVYDRKLIRVFFSKTIPLYPVKVLIPNYQLTISLVDFGKEMKSRFLPDRQKPTTESTEQE